MRAARVRRPVKEAISADTASLRPGIPAECRLCSQCMRYLSVTGDGNDGVSSSRFSILVTVVLWGSDLAPEERSEHTHTHICCWQRFAHFAITVS